MASDRSHLLSTLGPPKWKKEGSGVAAAARGIVQAITTAVGGSVGSFPNLMMPPAVPQRMSRALVIERECGAIGPQTGFSMRTENARRAFEQLWGRMPWFRGTSLWRSGDGVEHVSVCVDNAYWMDVIHDRRFATILDVPVAMRSNITTREAIGGSVGHDMRWDGGRPVYEDWRNAGHVDIHGTLKLAGIDDRSRAARKRLLAIIRQNAVKQVQFESIPPYGFAPVMGLVVYVDPLLTVVKGIPNTFDGYRVIIRPIGTPIDEFGESGTRRMVYRPQPEDPCWYVGWDTMSPDYASQMARWYGERVLGQPSRANAKWYDDAAIGGGSMPVVGATYVEPTASQKSGALAFLAIGLGVALILAGRTA